MQSFNLEIITPQHTAFSGPVEGVFVPTQSGTIGVLANHTALFCPLTEGEVKVAIGKQISYYAIGGGFMQVSRNTVAVLVSRAVHADKINEAEIKKAQAAATEALSRKVKGDEYDQAQAVLRRSLIEFKVLRRRKGRISF